MQRASYLCTLSMLAMGRLHELRVLLNFLNITTFAAVRIGARRNRSQHWRTSCFERIAKFTHLTGN